MKDFARSRIEGVTTTQWGRIERLCHSSGASLEETRLRSETGVTPKTALKIILSFGQEDVADLFWRVFHEGHFATRRRYDKGFQPVPWTCPECEERIDDENELRYEMQAVLRTPLRFT